MSAHGQTGNGSSANTQQDELINYLTKTTNVAVNSKLESLLNIVSSPSTGNNDIDRKLDGIRSDLDSLTSTQSDEQEQIRKLLDEALNTEVLQHLQKEIEAQIDRTIETTVANLVEKELDKYVPTELRKQVDGQRTEMQQMQVQIRNSEAQRSNSFIKTPRQFGENLQHLINEKGLKSDLFPKTVNDLLALEDAKVAELVKFYGLKDSSQKTKAQNLNWFLREIGVTYQPNFLG